MRYPKYIRDIEDGMILKLTDDKTCYTNDLCGDELGIYDYINYKDSFSNSTEKEYNKYNKEIEESWDREARLTNKEWKVVIKILARNKNGVVIAEKLKEYLGYGDDI